MDANKLHELIARHVQCQRTQELIGWDSTVDPDEADAEAVIAREALYEYIRELEVPQRVVPLNTNLTESLRQFDASRYKHVLLVAIEEPTLKPDVFSFGNGANPMEEIAALFTATTIRANGR